MDAKKIVWRVILVFQVMIIACNGYIQQFNEMNQMTRYLVTKKSIPSMLHWSSNRRSRPRKGLFAETRAKRSLKGSSWQGSSSPLSMSSSYLDSLSSSPDASSPPIVSSNKVTPEDLKKRPDWAPDWAPTWAVTLSPVKQVLIVLIAYALHLGVFCRTSINLPFQLFPNRAGFFQALGLDSLAGIISLALFCFAKGKNGHRPIAPVEGPWKVSKTATTQIKVFYTTVILCIAYLSSGYGAGLWENFLFVLADIGVPITTPMHRSLQVLLAHLSWVFMGMYILGSSFKPFFSKQTKWMKMKWRSIWVWWTLGGYFLSAFVFNLCDVANQFLLPEKFFEVETVVSKMINPENNDILAMAVGSIAPCMTAPWWEEVLYRGYILPALTSWLPQKWAIPVSGILFAVHHMNMAGMIPLMGLGFLWALLYVRSQNLVVTIIIHAMWNSRVFLGSYLGV